MTDREIFEEALKALESAERHGAGDWGRLKDALRDRLAQPEPESVRDLLISAAAMAVVAERQGKYEGASWVADAVLNTKVNLDETAKQISEPVAMRYDFDGYGYKYIDSGSGSNWQTRIKDAEPLYAAPVVPVQEPVYDCCANCLRPKHEHRGEDCPKPHTTVWHAWDYDFPPSRHWRQPEQEPVAWWIKDPDYESAYVSERRQDADEAAESGMQVRPLFFGDIAPQPVQEPAYRCRPYSSVPGEAVSPPVDYYTSPQTAQQQEPVAGEYATCLEDGERVLIASVLPVGYGGNKTRTVRVVWPDGMDGVYTLFQFARLFSPVGERTTPHPEQAVELRRLHADEVIAAHAKRLALELECLLLSCGDTAAVSRWWDSAHEALALYRADLDRLYPPPPTFMGEPVVPKGVA